MAAACFKAGLGLEETGGARPYFRGRIHLAPLPLIAVWVKGMVEPGSGHKEEQVGQEDNDLH